MKRSLMKAIEPTSGLSSWAELTNISSVISGITDRILFINSQTKVGIGEGCIGEGCMILFLKKQKGLYKCP
ncbi:hypothetical protein GCM10028810_41620 [Spirosoma litoris]